MGRYRFAGCIVEYDPVYGLLRRQMEPYRIEDTWAEPDVEKEEADIVLTGTIPYYEEVQRQQPHLTLEQCEYILTGAEFYTRLLKKQGFLIHASAVEKDGKAYLFSAPSGTGKSTHTALWQKHFAGEEVRIINDDKPAVSIREDGVYACGTPFSGKTEKNENREVLIRGLCMLHRGKENRIRRITPKEALPQIMQQTIRPRKEETMTLLFQMLDVFLQKVPVYQMECTISEEAAEMAWMAMKGDNV